MSVETLKVFIRWSTLPHPLLALSSGGFHVAWNSALSLPKVGERFEISIMGGDDEIELIVERRSVAVMYAPDRVGTAAAILWVRRA